MGRTGKQRTSVMMAADKHFSFLAQKPHSSSTWQLFAEQGRLSILFSPLPSHPYVCWLGCFFASHSFAACWSFLFSSRYRPAAGWRMYFLLPFCTFYRVSIALLNSSSINFAGRRKIFGPSWLWRECGFLMGQSKWVGEKNWRSFSFVAARYSSPQGGIHSDSAS